MEKILIQFIKTAAAKLHDSKLKRLDGKEMTFALEGVVQALDLDSKDEAILFLIVIEQYINYGIVTSEPDMLCFFIIDYNWKAVNCSVWVEM